MRPRHVALRRPLPPASQTRPRCHRPPRGHNRSCHRGQKCPTRRTRAVSSSTWVARRRGPSPLPSPRPPPRPVSSPAPRATDSVRPNHNGNARPPRPGPQTGTTTPSLLLSLCSHGPPLRPVGLDQRLHIVRGPRRVEPRRPQHEARGRAAAPQRAQRGAWLLQACTFTSIALDHLMHMGGLPHGDTSASLFPTYLCRMAHLWWLLC